MRSAESTKKEMRRLDCFFSTESRRRVNHLLNHSTGGVASPSASLACFTAVRRAHDPLSRRTRPL
jgi:hypothetical protein